MLFYEVELTSIPKIKYNCAVTSFGYRASINPHPNLLELCYIEAGGCICHTSSDTLICEPGYLYPLTFSEKCEMYSEINAPTKMCSIGIEGSFSISYIDSEKLSQDETRALMKRLLASNRFLLPKNGISSFSSEWLIPYIKKIITCKTGERIGEETHAISMIFEFMSRITKSCMDTVAFDAKAFPTSAIAYSEMAVSYIIKNYQKKISVTDIAEEFGLTPNYLHAIFKQVKGVTIIEYLTSYRMELAKTYIERFGLRSYEAANLVGIDDAAYFSRVFKKLYGKSINEFKKS